MSSQSLPLAANRSRTRDARRALGRSVLRTVLTYSLLIALAIIMLMPFIWMVSASLKLDKDVFRFPIEWIPSDPQWRNYETIWTRIPFLTFFTNTIKLTTIITFLQVATSSLAAYAFAKLDFRGRDILFLAYLGSIAIPWQVYMIPQFIIMRELGMVDSHMSLILLQAFTAFGVFLLRQFFISVPNELLDRRARRAERVRHLLRIMLPLSKPALATLTIFSAVFVWNDFMGPDLSPFRVPEDDSVGFAHVHPAVLRQLLADHGGLAGVAPAGGYSLLRFPAFLC